MLIGFLRPLVFLAKEIGTNLATGKTALGSPKSDNVMVGSQLSPQHETRTTRVLTVEDLKREQPVGMITNRMDDK